MSTSIISIDPGLNSGIAWGSYDSITPYRLLERWQVHQGAAGLAEWIDEHLDLIAESELVIECFETRKNEFVADTTPLLCEGVILGALKWAADGALREKRIIWQTPGDKATLIGYPPEADTPDKRQRLRFDFLDRFGLFREGTEFDDSNDSVTHALVSLKRRKHAPTLYSMWPPRKLRD